MSFLPKNYEAPKSQSNYLKLEEGQNKFRIISSAIVGYEYWTEDNKPVRMTKYPENKPTDMRADSKIKHFWAFGVIDREDGAIKILELTQVSIMKAIKVLVDSEDWGDPKGYDFNITRTGKGIETEYTCQPSPHKMLTPEEIIAVKAKPINLDALYDGEDPFEKKIKIEEIF